MITKSRLKRELAWTWGFVRALSPRQRGPQKPTAAMECTALPEGCYICRALVTLDESDD